MLRFMFTNLLNQSLIFSKESYWGSEDLGQMTKCNHFCLLTPVFRVLKSMLSDINLKISRTQINLIIHTVEPRLHNNCIVTWLIETCIRV